MAFIDKLITTGCAVALCSVVSSVAFAGGFSSSFGSPIGGISAKALSKNYSYLTSKSGTVSTKNYARVSHKTLHGNNGNKILKGFAEAGNKVNVYVNGQVCKKTCYNGLVKVDQKSVAKTKLYIKGKNILAKAYAKNNVYVKVQGQLAFENEEYAYAIGRFTPLGTVVQSGGTSRNKLEAKGLVRLETGQVVKASGQVGK